MDHRRQVENSKYRNWVRGGLVYKYLKEGIESFADEVVVKEHKRILQDVNHTPGLTCNQCSLRTLRPLHNSEKDLNTGKAACPWGQVNCNCLFKNKQSCRNKLCDKILEEVLNTHGSTPPTPNWKNTDIQKWCSTPWEVAKCFINAPGYAEKTTASKIDAPGLLHIFINNINLQTNLACGITGTDVFHRVLKRRNEIVHSPTMELEDIELNGLIDDVVEILKDEKKMKENADAKRAVQKLMQLKTDNFIITTHDEVEVCRTAMASIAKKSEELKQQIEDTKTYIESKQSEVKQTAAEAEAKIDAKRTEVVQSIDDKAEQTKKDLEKQTGIELDTMKKTILYLKEKVKGIDLDNTVIKQRLIEVEDSVTRLDDSRSAHQRQLKYVEQKQACQKSFVKLYQEHYVKTWISPLEIHDNNININEVYVKPSMSAEEKEKESYSANGNINSRNESDFNRYREIFRTKASLHNRIYIVGDVGTGKSSLAKMMMDNWCKGKAEKSQDNIHAISTNDSSVQTSDDVDDIHEMRRFNFLFFIPLQRMSGLTADIVEMIKIYYKCTVPSQLLERILEEESDRCLIIADGLDEWTPPRMSCLPQHVSFGIPHSDGIQNATIITFSRPSAKGILNMKSTECDKKIKLHGIDAKAVNEFITKYISKQAGHRNSLDEFLWKIREKRLEHLEKTPLLLQQVIYMYCMGHGIGSTISSIYSNIVNIMFGWKNSKQILGNNTYDEIKDSDFFQQMNLPELLKRFPRCRENKRCLFLLGKIAFEAFVEEMNPSTFSQSSLLDSGLSRDDIVTLKKFGILVENKCINAICEETNFQFLNMSYLEFFAALNIASQNSSTVVLGEIFKKYKRTADILQLSNLLKMMCGLSPFLVGEMSKLISDNVTNDETMLKYRKNIHEYENRFIWRPTIEAGQIHNLMFNCVCESGTDGTHVFSLCDIVIDDLISDQIEMSLLEKVIPDSVLSLNFCLLDHENQSNLILKWVHQLHRLQYMIVHNRFRTKTPHLLCSMLGSSVQQAVSLKHLVLKNIECSAENCKGHTIDLSRHTQLQSIHIVNCLFYVQKTGNLDTFHMSRLSFKTIRHETCNKILSSLAKAVSSKQITLKCLKCSSADCTGHTIDLSKHTQIHRVYLQNCPFQDISLGNIGNLESVYVSWSLCKLKAGHETCDKLASLLTQAVSLKYLKLERIECSREFCTGHTIDLSRHTQLRSIHLQNCPFQAGHLGNTEHLGNVHISCAERSYLTTQHGTCDNLTSSLTQTTSLKHLALKNLRCSLADCTGHTIDISEHAQLRTIHLEYCAFQVRSFGNTASLEIVHIAGSSSYRTTLHDTFCNLSLSLTKAVSLKHLTLESLICSSADCTGHTLDLCRQVQCRIIHLENCPFQVGSLGNTEKLQNLCISCSQRPYIEEHKTCENLSSSLTQAVSLKYLTLKHVKCKRTDCTGHNIDLCKHDRLQYITLNDSDLSVINVKANEKIDTGSPGILAQLESVYKTSKLKHLCIHGNLFSKLLYTSEMNCVLHTLEGLQSLKLEHASIGENALTVSPIMQNLKNIEIFWVEMNFQTWRTFVDSLLSLKQSILVDTIELMIDVNKTSSALEYVRQSNNMFETVLTFPSLLDSEFSFKTQSE